MAMSIEKANRKLVAILTKLNEAIDDRDQQHASDELKNLDVLNKKAEGMLYSDIADKLKIIRDSVIGEINGGELEASELTELLAIKGKIEGTMDPFKNTREVINGLLQNDLSTQELIDMQQDKKDSNDRDINAYEQLLNDKAKDKVNMLNECILPLNENKKRIELLKKLKSAKETYDRVASDPSLAGAKNNAISAIKKHITDLRNLGVTNPDLDSYETNPNYISSVIDSKVTYFENKNFDIAKDYAAKNIKDFPGLDDGSGQIDTVSNTDADILKAVEEKYKELTINIKKLETAKNTLTLENREIDKNIGTMKIQDAQVNRFAGRSEEEVIEDALNDTSISAEAENRVGNQLTARTRFGRKMQYYREYENNGRIKAFFKSLFSREKNVKRLAVANEGYNIVKENHDRAAAEIYRGKEEFRKSLRQVVAKESAHGRTIDENKIKEDAKKVAMNKRIEGR